MNTLPQQLDIFEHSHEVMLRNDVLAHLLDRAAVPARKALQVLAAGYPQDRALADFERLVMALEGGGPTALPDHAAVAHARAQLLEHVAPAARRTTGDGAAAWLRESWHELAQRATHLPFQAHLAEDHAAALWLRAERWADAARAAASIESWRRIPAPLAWMVQARCQQGELDACWGMLAELAWLAPARLDALLRDLNDPLLRRLHKKFGAEFDGTGELSDLAWFPAWALVASPALAPHLAQARASQHSAPERGMRLVLELLGLERQGRHHELVQRRRALRDLHGPLYAAYMATR